MENKRIVATVVVVAALTVPAGRWTAKGAVAGFNACNPEPADGATAVMAPLFQWIPGDTTVFHDAYFGTDPDLRAEQREVETSRDELDGPCIRGLPLRLRSG